MAVEIGNVLRAIAGVNATGATTFEWWGSGISDIQRTGVGVFVVTFDREVDPTQAVPMTTPKGIGGQGNAFYTTEVLTSVDCTIRVFDDTSAPADPGTPGGNGFFFTLNVSDIETDWTEVA